MFLWFRGPNMPTFFSDFIRFWTHQITFDELFDYFSCHIFFFFCSFGVGIWMEYFVVFVGGMFCLYEEMDVFVCQCVLCMCVGCLVTWLWFPDYFFNDFIFWMNEWMNEWIHVQNDLDFKWNWGDRVSEWVRACLNGNKNKYGCILWNILFKTMNSNEFQTKKEFTQRKKKKKRKKWVRKKQTLVHSLL